MADTLRYWDGGQWTEHRSPVTPAATARRAEPTGPDNSVGWALAFAPLIIVLISVVLYQSVPASTYQDASLGIALVLNISLALWDRKKMAAAGYDLEATWAILLVPLYLIERARKVPRTTAITLTWFGAFLVSLLFYY
jgi:hypothetical protein